MKKLTSYLLATLLFTTLISCESSDSVDSGYTPDPDAGVVLPDDPQDSAPAFAANFPEENDDILYKPKFSSTTTYYVDPDNGDDNNSGTSIDAPLKTLSAASAKIAPGVSILLKGGAVHYGMLSVSNKGGAKEDIFGDNTMFIGSYGDKKARINAYGYPMAIKLENCRNVVVADIKIDANGGPLTSGTKMYSGYTATERYGIGVLAGGVTTYPIGNFEINNVDIRNVYYFNTGDSDIPSERPCRQWSTLGEGNYGWGFYVKYQDYAVNNIVIKDCTFNNISHTAIKMVGKSSSKITNIDISGCSIKNTGGPGAMFEYCEDGVMRNCSTSYPGSRSDERMWGRGSGMWLDNCDGFLFEKNSYLRSEGIADCCGAHIDLQNKNITIQYCLSRENAGGFIEILGDNYNCCYRYNISINDGWRNVEDASQSAYWGWIGSDGKVIGNNGCLVTLNGLNDQNGEKQFSGPFKSYIYNNTIVQTSSGYSTFTNPFVLELATSAKDVLIQNNLFWIPQQMTTSWSSHYYDRSEGYVNNAYDFKVLNADSGGSARDMTQNEIDELNFVVKNNLYKLYDSSAQNLADVLPDKYWDENPLSGDPIFANANGLEAEDMIPSASSTIGQGTVVEKLSGDPIGVSCTSDGVSLDLNPGVDFFGNPISGYIIGACVAQ